ncbi:MAG: type II secretion protein F [Micavibrio aeruginosavorus]|uniref:Type II secretion protein F n=1 Tax=Micavibrio aeruginosavorus TaxID=349221 RepID=A0A2W5N0F9_9BACT|nr:MAG: type II secretion protein F [Micavibrio aeruginosavorus]
MDKSILITVVSLLLVLVVTGMIAFMVANSKSAKKRRMMSVIRGGVSEDGGRKGNAVDMRREALAKKLKENKDPDSEEKKKSLSTKLKQAGLTISVKQFWLYSVLLAVVLTGLVYLSGKGPFVVAMTAIIGFFGLPKFILKRLTLRRQKKFLSELPDALEAMTRLLRAGMPVSEAIKMVAREFTGPIGEEMGHIFDQQKIGVPLPEAVQECGRRIPLPEVRMFATAVAIQAQTGSSLSEILDGLAKVIRARFRLRRKVQALSSEAKSSAMIIGALPVLVATGMYFLNYDYISVLFYEPKGKVMLAGAVLWMCCGIFCMRQMINFKV